MITRLRQVSPRHVMADVPVMAFSGFFSWFLLGLHEGPADGWAGLGEVIALLTGARVAVFAVTGVYETIWRYVSLADALRLARAAAASSLVAAGVGKVWLGPLADLPVAYWAFEAMVAVGLLGGARVLRRRLHEAVDQKEIRKEGRRTVIFGAGYNGVTLARRFATDGRVKTNLIGFVDDDRLKRGHSIAGVKVLGGRAELAEILRNHQIEELVISVPNLEGKVLNRILKLARGQGTRVKMLTEFGLSQSALSRQESFREVELDDLLNRPRAEIDLASVQALIRGKRVLVTGAGGSIGSELSRQIHALGPAQLLLLDHAEYNLYQIDRELRPASDDSGRVVPLLMDLRDRESLEAAMREYRPELVFHAAAYKHVPLVQHNPFTAILNNIEGLKNLLDLSEAQGVGTFLLISTDKAVNPVSVMGATKRLCELMVAARGRKTGKRYCAVRFGNVVGSSGSLLPLLKTQIRDGGPVTITHEEMTRYFMLIREAVALVLKAASISGPGGISILRMGEPIRIVDIARNLITLLGKTEEQVPIVFTGMRPGERLHEELYYSGDEVSTEHPDILLLPQGAGGWAEESGEVLDATVAELLDAARGSKGDAVGMLMAVVNPGEGRKAAALATSERVAAADLLRSAAHAVGGRASAGAPAG